MDSTGQDATTDTTERKANADTRGATDPAPVMVLGCHRSGTSAVAGLLVVAGGLRIGEPLPPTAANPKGYYESAVVVKAHNDALARLDRDWTCPPTVMPPDPLASELIRAEVEQLTSESGPWGVKDPRLLFTLGLWCETLPGMRFIGVVRDQEEIARSLMDRDGIRAARADEIVRAHVRRLRLLRDHLAFPIVDFSSPSTFLDAMGDAADALGLDWDADAAARFYDTDLPGNRGAGHDVNVDLDALVANEPVTHAATVDSARVRDVLAEVAAIEEAEHGPVTRLSLHGGLRAAIKRKRLWAKIPEDLHEHTVELTRNDRLATRGEVAPKGATVIQVQDIGEVLAAVTTFDDVGAVIAGDFASWLPPNQLRAFVGLLAERVGAGTPVMLATSKADQVAVAMNDRTAITFNDVLKAVEEDFRIVDTGDDDCQQWVRLVARDMAQQPRPPVEVPWSEWEVNWQERHARLAREHEELQSSRLVSAALAVGRSAGPAVRAWRKARSRLGGSSQ